MRRAVKILAFLAGLGLLVWAGLLTAPRWLPPLAQRLSGGTAVLSGLSGRMPDHLRLAHLELRDATGAWATADDLRLDWSPLALLTGGIGIADLAAEHVVVTRLPAASDAPPSSGSDSFPFPRIGLDRLHVGRLDVAAALAGHDASLRLDGDLQAESLTAARANLLVQRQDSPGRYELHAVSNAAGPHLALTLDEPAAGLLANLADLPTLGPVHVEAALDGPLAANRILLHASAGPLAANAEGVVDFNARTAAAFDLTVRAPAMTPASDLSWQSIDLVAHASGPLLAPTLSGHLELAMPAASGVRFDRLDSQFSGKDGQLDVDATVAGLVVPGPAPGMFAAAPIAVKATLSPSHAVTFSLSHPLLDLAGQASFAATTLVTAHATLPDLAPLAAIGEIALQGRAAFDLSAEVDAGADTGKLTLDGTVGVSSGPAPVVGLLGEAAKLSIAASRSGDGITLSHLTLGGKSLDLSANGADDAGRLSLDWRFAVSDLAAAAPRLAGTLRAEGKLSGSTDRLGGTADVLANLGFDGQTPAPLALNAALDDILAAPVGTVTAQGQLAGAPLRLDTRVARAEDGTLRVDVAAAAWKSLHAEGAATLLPGGTFPSGELTVAMTRLADLSALIGQPIAGSLQATLHARTEQGTPVAALDLKLRGLDVGQVKIDAAGLTARIRTPFATPDIAATLTATGLAAGGAISSLDLTVAGRPAALDLRLKTTTADLGGADAAVSAAGLLDLPQSRLRLTQFDAAWHGETLHLDAPAALTWAKDLAIDRLQLGLGATATLTVAGRLSPTLALQATARNITPDLAKPFAPDLDAAGTLQADATLGGTPANPTGHLRLVGSDLRELGGAARALAPASLTVTADLADQAVRIDARVIQGANHLTLAGTASPTGLDLQAQGGVDLALLDPILLAQGRRLHGQTALSASIGGTPEAPQIAGTATLTRGELQDYTQGIHLTDLAASLSADGQTLRIDSLSAKAGSGTITASGTVGLEAPQPVAIHLVNRNAQLLASDAMTAVLDGDLTLGGSLEQGLSAAGELRIGRAELRLPEQMPVSVASITVIRPGQKPPAAAPAALPMTLAIQVKTRDVIFVRGHGVDAELTGDLQVSGDLDNPDIRGAFDLRRGSYTLANTTLDFSMGRVSFDGGHGYDPALDFVASTTSDNVTATLTIGGYASKPKITLSSVPDLPQEEIMSHLLFSSGTAQLSPFQIAEIGSALASLSGIGVGLNDPLEFARKTTGLDRLSVGSGGADAGPSLEGGRYVARGVYVGAKQGAGSSDTTAEVRIDLGNRLKLETDVGNSKDGSNVGLTYELEY